VPFSEMDLCFAERAYAPSAPTRGAPPSIPYYPEPYVATSRGKGPGAARSGGASGVGCSPDARSVSLTLLGLGECARRLDGTLGLRANDALRGCVNGSVDAPSRNDPETPP
jgi:hypothetical protein